MKNTDRPDTAAESLRAIADWMDTADRLINTLAERFGRDRPGSGDEVQQDLRRLAEWFADNPVIDKVAWEYVAQEEPVD